MAAPHVSGLAALIIANNMAATPDEVRNVLESSAKDKDVSGWDPKYGYGIIDADAAVNYAPSTCGNYIIEGNEECDGEVPEGANCETLGYDGGTLACTDTCTFDTGDCTTTEPEEYCGNGYCAGADLGEDCNTCPADCPGRTTGRPSGRFCCGNGVYESVGENTVNCPVDCPQ